MSFLSIDEFENIINLNRTINDFKESSALGAIFILRKGVFGLFQTTHPPPEMLDSPSNKAPAIFVSFLLTEITTVMILGSFPYHGRTL